MTENQLSAHFSSNRDDWETPQEFFDRLNDQYHFTLDAAASAANAKCERYYTKEDDALSKSWSGERVWLNPPYGRKIGEWVRKAWEESQADGTMVVCLIPARTDTKWFHDYCLNGDIKFIRGRLKFVGGNGDAPFPSMLVIFPKE